MRMVLSAIVIILHWMTMTKVIIRKSFSRPLQIIIIVVCVFLVVYFYRIFLADIHLKKALNHSENAYRLITQSDVVRDIIIEGGQYYSDNEEWELAIKYYLKALKNNPDLFTAHYFLGNSFNRRWDLQPMYNPAWGDKDSHARIDAERALEEYDELRKQAPDYVEIHYELANLYIKLGKWDDALNYLKRYIELKPFFAKAQYYMAWVYTQKREWEKAEEWYKEALDLNNTFTQAYIDLSTVYYEQKKFELAQESYEKALEISPEYADRGIAYAYNKFREWDKAIEHYKKAIIRDPLNAVLYFEMGWCYTQKEELGKAVDSFNKTISLSDNFLLAYINLSNIYFAQGKKELAGEAFKKAMEIDPDFVNGLLSRIKNE